MKNEIKVKNKRTKDILFLRIDGIRFIFEVSFEKMKDYYDADCKKLGFRIESLEKDLDKVKLEFSYEMIDYIKSLIKINQLEKVMKERNFTKEIYNKKIAEFQNSLNFKKDLINVSNLANLNFIPSWNSQETNIS